MDFNQTMAARYSCRRFLDKPVAQEEIEALVKIAQRAPSWGNTQPWNVWVAIGDVAKNIRRDLTVKAQTNAAPSPELPMPLTFEEPMRGRYRSVGIALLQAMGIGRDDQDKRIAHVWSNYDAFGAPALVYLTIPDGQTSYALLDIGSIVSTFCLAAADRGLATCIQAALVSYPEEVRRHMAIAEGQKLVIGIALGYADPTAPANSFHSERDQLENILKIFS